jgi:putative SbcD/Mre11-related phosphoesterase
MLKPVPGEPAAVADCDGQRTLVLADYHAGLEVALRYDGVELRSRAAERREAALGLFDRTGADGVAFLGDLANAIGSPADEERTELRTLLSAFADRGPVTVVKGNHDGEVEVVTDDLDPIHPIEVTPTDGVRLGEVGFVHGHTWPHRDVLSADVVAMGHEHPMVRLEDEVGGARAERVWLRGTLDREAFVGRYDDPPEIDGELVVCPGFNDLLGGTWSNTGQGFLSPFLPEGFRDAQAYLLDGTRLGPYEQV